ncbi:MAG: 16S rRNA (guanine(966)-N(2))-methyltransferase RsmD [bacterium]
MGRQSTAGRAPAHGPRHPAPRPVLAQRVRIIGGHWRRRMISFPSAQDLRPTPDRVRETVFNWLGQDMQGLRCLDLFAGSGALGFEAASRGAERVVMVEQDPAILRALETTRGQLGEPPAGTRIEIVRADALRFVESEARRTGGAAHGHDVVFLDPPFRVGLLPALLARVEGCLAPGGWVYVEAPAASADGPGVLDALGNAAPWCTIRQARAGAVEYRILARQADLQADANPDSLGAGDPV